MVKWLLAFGLVASLVACAPSVYDRPYPVAPVALPGDEAAHAAPVEWWYYTGHLRDDGGREYGFELAFFEAYAPPSARLFGFLPARALFEKGHVAHFAITAKSAGAFAMEERSSLWGFDAGTSGERLEVFVGDWRARRAADGVSHEIVASLDHRTLRLVLTPEKRVALHGAPPGIQSMGPGGTSYYLSYTRMRATGTLESCAPGCTVAAVTGLAWHDHQWGDFELADVAGWDWFSVQFDDRRELMLYLIRAADGARLELAGSLVTAAGQTIGLTSDDVDLSVGGESWESPTTGAVYPRAWRLRVPRFGIDVRIEPVLQEQEMDTRASTGVVYWEGAVTALGWPTGVGYVELTNYDRYPFGGGVTTLKAPAVPLGF